MQRARELRLCLSSGTREHNEPQQGAGQQHELRQLLWFSYHGEYLLEAVQFYRTSRGLCSRSALGNGF